ncbi:MAG: hypothetical protein IKJ69_04000 [Clostridia bacterium]|nr:hypothetical protein [Clostridia bacterium]
MKNKNTLSKMNFMLYTLIFTVLTGFLYRVGCFTAIHGISITESKIVYWVMLFVLTSLGTLVNLKKRRNYLSLFVNISLPFEVYTLLSTYRYKYEVYNVFLIVAAVISVGYFIMVMTRKIENRKYIRPIMKNRIKYGLLGTRTIAVSLVMLLTAGVCSNVMFGNGLVRAEADTDISDSRYAEWTIENHIESLVLLDEASWNSLSVSEKINVLGIVKNIEMRKFGISHEVYLVASDLEDGIAGMYYAPDYRISIDIEHLKSSPPDDVLRTVLHESMHVYQRMCVTLYDQLDDEYKRMPMFDKALEYKKDFSNYVSGNEDFELYYNQTVESSARSYAEFIAEEYFCYIDEFLLYGDLPER